MANNTRRRAVQPEEIEVQDEVQDENEIELFDDESDLPEDDDLENIPDIDAFKLYVRDGTSWAYVGTLDNFSLEEIKENYGGGQYQVRFKRNGKSKAKCFRIAGANKQSEAGGVVSAQLERAVKAIEESTRKQSEANQSFMQQIVLKALDRPQAGNGLSEMIGLFQKGVSIGQESAAAVEYLEPEPPSMENKVMDILGSLLPLLLKQNNVPAQIQADGKTIDTNQLIAKIMADAEAGNFANVPYYASILRSNPDLKTSAANLINQTGLKDNPLVVKIFEEVQK